MDSIPGIIFINPLPIKEYSHKTFFVLGQARGGTSLAAGILYHLGIPMGEQCDKPIYEDGILTRAIRSGNSRKIKEIIANYNSHWPNWGFKQPAAQNFILRNHRLFRSPCFIFIVKDPASIAIRKESLYGNDAVASMRKVLESYDRILKFIAKTKAPALIVSYEKLIQNPESLIEKMGVFVGNKNLNTDSALEFIKAGNKNYQQFFENQLNQKRLHVEGHIDQITANQITGWAVDYNNMSPVVLSVEKNGIEIATAIAEDFRADLQQAKVHETGQCAYTISLPTEGKLIAGDVIRVFAGDAKVELSRSPWTIEN
tara:strand:- start:13312 stop:14253 length:942 start_codon:yes stop_codon:yes gene_type:complete